MCFYISSEITKYFFDCYYFVLGKIYTNSLFDKWFDCFWNFGTLSNRIPLKINIVIPLFSILQDPCEESMLRHLEMML